ncbi:molybdopterin-dependent oxidoreductase [soil metagenome]
MAVREPAARVNGTYVGAPVKRVNDRKLITGHGRFVDDIVLPDTVHVVFVHSPYAQADIVSIDSSAAEALPGVVSVVTGSEIKTWMAADVVHETLLPGRHLERYPLSEGRVLFAGDAVAAVLADSLAIARDAAELVHVEYNELPSVIRQDTALESSAPILYEGWDSNTAWHWHVEAGDVEAAFNSAPHQVTVDLLYQRVASIFLETRAILAHYDPNAEELTMWVSAQAPHRVRTTVAGLLGIPENAVRAIAPDVGGGFGSKGGVYSEYQFAAAASHHLGRPVKWIESRSEHMATTNHGRDQMQHLEAAVASDGNIEGLRVTVLSNCGAYGAATFGQRTGIMSTGPYQIKNLRTDVYGVMTNSTPTGAYRGAGRPEAAYMLERLIDRIAVELELDPVEVRRRNFVPADAFPYKGATGALYDSGNYAGALDTALEMLDWDATQKQIQQEREQGKLVGVGIGFYCEFAGPGWDSAEVRVAPSGSVTVMTGISPHGQGNETSLAQIVADELGIPMEMITVKASDTAITPQGVGTFGSRGTAIGGGAVMLASRKVQDKVKQFAAAMLEVSADDIQLKDSRAEVIGAPDRSVGFKQISGAAHAMDGIPGGLEPGLDAQSFFKPEGRQFPFGVHLAQVEIDRDTGEVNVTRYIAVDDCGTIINPLLVDGQKHGGLAQGFGQALWEEVVYDDNGQLLTGTIMDYAVPKANQFPTFELGSTVTPSPFTPHGAKGIGEAGTTGAPPAIVNAVLDALRPLGVSAVDMPLKSEKIWRLLQTT